MYRVLIVDDEPMIRKGLEKLIRQTGTDVSAYDIRMAENGEEALRLIEEERPDFLFTDIRMPKMDGLELCRRLALTEYDIQIVVISGYSDFEYAQKSVSYGVKEYLLKPVSKSSLYDVLAKLSAASRKQSQSAYISLAKLDEWVEQMETAIWSLQKDALDEALSAWRRDFMSYTLKPAQQTELLEQFYSLLVKKLLTRDVYPSSPQPDYAGAPNGEAAFERFTLQVGCIYEELRIKRKGKAKDPVEEAKAYIDKNLAKEVSLEEVAEVLGLNASYFSQLFKSATGETFVHYRIKCRMERAKKLLEQPHYRITDISYEVGYADHPHFTKTFKKYTGLSPSEYRGMLGIE